MRKQEQVEFWKLSNDICCYRAGDIIEVRVRRDYVEIEIDEGVYLKILNRMIDAYFVDEDVEEELDICDNCLIQIALEDYRDGKINFSTCKNILQQINTPKK